MSEYSGFQFNDFNNRIQQEKNPTVFATSYNVIEYLLTESLLSADTNK